MSETGKGEIVWRPTREHLERSRIARFMKAQGVADLATLQRRSVAEPEWYWDAVVKDLGIRWSRPYTRVLD
ncbi:MAG TPA: acetyl-coenzyme A synthetase N-terminal domain-containing protein, partial [Thermoleophilia bacterium]|nr:acetyl-coenzyme A synthetase N-terminal domain-containing protein [Thermoleophilia bacterium]